ncbi:AmmeMemoRadiSam system protein B [Candidatus Woesearchaeota archaeon]|nr:AmmeMemoRadiSam system protein B [Candidatus Woesearchaeota archaeon]
MREAAFAGYFYPASENGLRDALKEAFTGEKGPGSMPVKKVSRNVVAAIVPHAGYAYSSQCAAWAYHAIAASPKPDLFIILGPNHNSVESGTSSETWKTPFGMIRADQDFVRELTKKGNIHLDDEIMTREHAIEVQLPFLQLLDEKHKFVPIMVSQDADLKALAMDIKETLVETGKKAVFIVSSDFTHHGPDYKYLRFNEEPQKQIAAFDKQMIDMIKEQQGDEFLAFAEKELATVCGARAITLLLNILKPCDVKLEQYYTSAEVTGDDKNSVSYAAIVFEEK